MRPLLLALLLVACADGAQPRITDDTPRSPAEQIKVTCDLTRGQLLLLASALDRGEIDEDGAEQVMMGAHSALLLCLGELATRRPPRGVFFQNRAALGVLIERLENVNAVIPSR